jgi:hypothetical protein
MKKKRFTEEQIIGILREQEARARRLPIWRARSGTPLRLSATRLQALPRQGKVERPFRYIREDFFLDGAFRNLDDLNL